ncbi:hypothetical protein HYH03_016957 [Edaphochlamys debaryana]|uniref:Uncharacterized protein n=1 Tax=Edaphochlamys debaryana TaxID=47281 RepID=A0A835XJB6_9CHLO|nr:hypothetical protein HYH03_016957 [Edaphochlamys debaryana]|eukprot:KAG2484222.1 hypothetical protein HYH03_016957 [Edaphochlamys debaryana]
MASNAGNGGVDFADVRRRVAALRKPELMECLERLGMRKGGKKAELQQRLLDIFADGAALVSNGYGPRDMWRLTAAQRIIEDVHNKLTRGYYGAATGAGGLAAGAGPSGAALGAGAAAGMGDYKPGGGAYAAAANNPLAAVMSAYTRDRAQHGGAGGSQAAAPRAGGGPAAGPGPGGANGTVRCTCGGGAADVGGPMLQCRAPGCGVWQHAQCAGVGAGRPAAGEFFCETCRTQRADPFWEIDDAGISTVMRLSSTGKQAAVTGHAPQAVRQVERAFNVTLQQQAKYRSRSSEYQLQLVCLQLNDPVAFRLHWPLGAALEVNGVQYRVYSRNSTQKLGANGRDEPANIGLLCNTGRSRLTMTCTDNQPYVLLALLMRRRSAEEVRALMKPPLSRADAVERVKQQLRGDDDDEVQTGTTVLSLRCPLTGSRVRTPGRFAEVAGLACFDLDAFLDSAARTRKWQCPHSMAHTSVQSLMVDTYTQRILAALAHHPSVTEVEVAADGGWRPRGSRDRFYSIEEDDPLGGAAGPSGRGLGGADGANGANGAGDSDGEETDEEEELRQAAAAVAAASKRKRPAEPEVIEIDDSDDEGGGPGGGSAAAGGSAGRGAAPTAPPPLRQGAGAGGSAAAPAANGGGHHATATTAAPAGPLRIPLGVRAPVPGTVAMPGAPHAGGRTAGAPAAVAPAAAAAAAAGAVGQHGVVSTQRQHFEHLAAAAAVAAAGGHASHAAAAQPRAAPQGAGAGGAAGPGPSSVAAGAARQPAAAAGRNPIRITLAADMSGAQPAGTGAGHASVGPGGPAAAAPGLPNIAPYRPSPAAAPAGPAPGAQAWHGGAGSGSGAHAQRAPTYSHQPPLPAHPPLPGQQPPPPAQPPQSAVYTHPPPQPAAAYTHPPPQAPPRSHTHAPQSHAPPRSVVTTYAGRTLAAAAGAAAAAGQAAQPAQAQAPPPPPPAAHGAGQHDVVELLSDSDDDG